MENVISLVELIEQRLDKEREISFYKKVLEELQIKITALDKDVQITTMIIDLIQQEKLLTADERVNKLSILEDKVTTKL
jgi:hypothetical protein|tara:strand:- start:417 stop:653 length:237 start_codon:yes stop_codon:yes gene_type:complete